MLEDPVKATFADPRKTPRKGTSNDTALEMLPTDLTTVIDTCLDRSTPPLDRNSKAVSDLQRVLSL